MPSIKTFYSYLYKTDNLKSKYSIIVFAAYVILLAVVVAAHEPWMDEAQAWLLAKDTNPAELFIKYLRYEGSPGLWHLILMIPAKLGFPYFTLNVLATVFSAFGVWLFLRCSPFPPIIKILFPFSYFIIFQYAAVARSYCLISPILFLIAIKYKTKIEQPIIFSLLLCLLANVSTHTFLIAGAIFAVHFLDVAKAWKRLDKTIKINQITAFSMFGLTSVFLFFVLLPPSDHFLDTDNNWSLTNFLNSSGWAMSGALVLDEASPLYEQIWFSLTVFFVTTVWLRYKKLTLLFLLPLLLILALFAVKYRNLWHDGITFILWIFVLWVGFARDEIRVPKILARTLPVLITIVLATQVYWSAFAIHHDIQNNYSGSYDLAGYIKENQLENQKIFASGWKSIAVQPYFDKNIFYNHNKGSGQRFWNWSNTNQTHLGANQQVLNTIQKDQPDIVIFASDHLEPEAITNLQGYRLERVFDGRLFWKTGVHEFNYYWLFRRAEQ